MLENDEFWTDDYSKGSFKNWLRQKYTGPYLSLCHGEGLISCQNDMKRIDPDEKYYLLSEGIRDTNINSCNGISMRYTAYPMYGHDGRKRDMPKPWQNDVEPYSVVEKPFCELPAESISMLFNRNAKTILERLPIENVLIPDTDSSIRPEEENGLNASSHNYDGRFCLSGSEIFKSVEADMNHIIGNGIDQPDVQVLPPPFTDALIYRYDFGDDWNVLITASKSAHDLIEAGRLTQTNLDRSIAKCRKTYRPVLLARDGKMLIDDVGGLDGFAELLAQAHELSENISGQQDKPDSVMEPSSCITGNTKQTDSSASNTDNDLVVWAESMGWHWNDSSDFYLL